MIRSLSAPLRREEPDDFLHVFGARPVDDQHRIGRFHHNDMVETDRTDQAAGGVHQGIAAVVERHVAIGHVALCVLAPGMPDRIPRAKVGPLRFKHDHLHVKSCLWIARAFLQHGIVDRLGGNRGKQRLVGPRESAIRAAPLPCKAGRLRDVGTMRFNCPEPSRCPDHEHAAVPEIAALCKVVPGRFDCRLLGESSHVAHCATAFAADVAKSGFGPVGLDADQGDAAILRLSSRPCEAPT